MQKIKDVHDFVMQKNRNGSKEKQREEEDESYIRALLIELERAELQDLKEESKRAFNQARESVKQTFGKDVTLDNYKKIQRQVVKNDDERSVKENFVNVVSKLRKIKKELKAFNLEHGTTSQ
tara:strand:+ start:506 stop:871 length:366 start_codon:yes stop_codon:yes gene_type:complete